MSARRPDPKRPNPQRGEATREAILQAAMEVFGEDGFHAASTRRIAEAADANQALISYHFGSKERLYEAVFEHIADRIEALMGPLIDSATAEMEAAPRAGGVEVCTRLVLMLANGFVAMLTREESTPWARLILREQQAPSRAFDILYQRLMGRVIGLLTRLVARIAGRHKVTDRDRLTALTVMGQALIFRAGRAAVMRHLGWTAIGQAEVAAIQERVAANVSAVLRASQRVARG